MVAGSLQEQASFAAGRAAVHVVAVQQSRFRSVAKLLRYQTCSLAGLYRGEAENQSAAVRAVPNRALFRCVLVDCLSVMLAAGVLLAGCRYKACRIPRFRRATRNGWRTFRRPRKTALFARYLVDDPTGRAAGHDRGRYQGAVALPGAAGPQGHALRRGRRRRGLWLDRHGRGSPARRNGRIGTRQPR